MKKEDNIVLKEMISVMIVYGIIAQIVCLFILGDRLRMAMGLWIGVLTAIGMAVNMKHSTEEALYLDQEDAVKYIQRAYMKRYTIVAIVFIVVAYWNLVNILTLFIGVMGLKISAYLHPIAHQIFQKLKNLK